VFRLAPPGELERVLPPPRFSDVRVEARRWCSATRRAKKYWQIQTDLAAPLKAAMATLSAEDVSRLKARVFETIAPHMEGDVVKFAAVPLCASATK